MKTVICIHRVRPEPRKMLHPYPTPGLDLCNTTSMLSSAKNSFDADDLASQKKHFVIFIENIIWKVYNNMIIKETIQHSIRYMDNESS